jgi:hypothetical protein
VTPYFDLDQAVEIANQAVTQTQGRPLTDVEILVLKGAWDRDSYDQIAARNQYSTSYISQDIAPKLWKLLSEAVGEKIKKNSLREPLKRYWEQQLQASTAVPAIPAQPSVPAPKVLYQRENRDTDAPFPTYVHRPDIETLCYDTLLNYPGTLVRIKSAKLTGKTSLVNYVLNKLAAQGVHTVNLSLRLADSQIHFNSIDIFLRWFCFNIEQELGLESQLDHYWNVEWLGSKVSCTTYLEKYLLAQDDAPVVLCIDDVDLLFPHQDLYEDFFGLLRSWYEKARSRPQWKKLRLILAHSTEAYIRLNINQSPFNVGLPIELEEFSLEQSTELAQRTGWEGSPEDVGQLITLLGGHPYLLEKAFNYLKAHGHISLVDFIATAPTQAGIYRNHLQEIWQELKERPELEAAFRPVLTAEEPISIAPTLAYQLQSMGLITLTGNLAQASCQLYRQYFQANLKTDSPAEAMPHDTEISTDPN